MNARQQFDEIMAEEQSTNGKGVYSVYSDFKELPAAEEFPVDALPTPCRSLVREGAASIVCPPDLIAVPMLAVLGGGVGNSRVVELKKGWTEGAAVYAVAIARPGEKKSPAFKEAIEPATRTQAALQEKYRVKLDEYKREMREYEVEKREAAQQKHAAPPPPEAPVMERTVVADTTVEALAPILEGNARGVLAMRAELSGWVKSHDQYKAGGKEADRQFWLEAWSNSYVCVDRKSQPEPMILPRPFVGLFGSIQPAVLSELGGDREDGLMDRFLFAYPEPVPYQWSDAEISEATRENYQRLYDRLRNLPMPEDEYGTPVPARTSFSPDAKAVFVAALNEHHREMEILGFSTRLKGPWAKLEAYFARFCLILALSRIVDEEGAPERIECGDVLRAKVLLDYFKNQARRVYVGLYGENPDDLLARDIKRFLTKHGGSWRGQPEEFHQQLASDYKPERAAELSKKVREIASRTPTLHFHDGQVGATKDDGRRTTRRVMKLTLENAVNTVNGDGQMGAA